MIKQRGTKTILFLTILFLTLMLAFTFSPIQNIASAATCITDADCKKGEGCKIEEGKKEGECVRALEIVYPQIPGYTTEKVVFSGLPEYIEYIFRFSIWLIGFVILGALIYAGFQYFTSFGNPEKFSAAKNGIISAFLGGIILLGAVLIFNTINPQLVILEAPPLDILDPSQEPGIYLCNYKPDNVRGAIESYLYGTKEEKIEAAKELKKIMQDGKNTCFKVSRSWNLDFEFDPKLHDIFVIPWIDYVYDPENPSEPRVTPVNDFGLIFHEKDRFLGKYFLAVIYPEDTATYPNFSARSVTLFQKPDQEPDSSKLGVILYQCLDYNEGGFCPVEGIPDKRSFKPGEYDYITKVAPADLGPNLRSPQMKITRKTGYRNLPISKEEAVKGTRSIKIDPEGSYFAILYGYGEDRDSGLIMNYSDFSEVISNNDSNLLDNEIGRCGADCRIVSKDETKDWQNKNCYPCLQSMIVIKGKVIK